MAKETKKQVKAKESKKSNKESTEEEPKKGKAKKEKSGFNVAAMFGNSLDEISHRQGFDFSGLDTATPMSTGILAYDLILDGGLRPGMLTGFGPEQSAKTTGALSIMGTAIKKQVPVCVFVDFEGSTQASRPYVQSILDTMGVEANVDEVFGVKEKNSGKWKIRPLVNYRAESVAENFFDWLSEFLRQLPDKRKVEGEWWLVFDDSKINRAKVGEHAVKGMANKHGKGIWVKSPDEGNLQAVILLDSYPAMNPRNNDDEDGDNSLALQARMFSKQLPRVKGRLAAKAVVLYGLNQLRTNPMARFSNPEVEPGGQALKFNSDVRIRQYPRALSSAPLWPKAGDKIKDEVEKSATGKGKDQYRYVHIKAIKNKLSIPQREAWFRIWVEDCNGEAKGIDPVFDTIFYLKETGQLKMKNRKQMVMRLAGQKECSIDWVTIKKWVLGEKKDMIEICKAKGLKPMNLRKFCFKQVESGQASELYTALKNDSEVKEQEDDDSSGSDD